MSELYNNLKMLGYKINELPSEYLLAQAPSGSVSLFDTNLNMVQNSIKSLTQISDKLYLAELNIKSKENIVLFDNESNILESYETPIIGRKYTQGYNAVVYTDYKNTTTSVYEKDLKAQFKLSSERALCFNKFGICPIIKHEGTYKLITFNNSKKLILIDTDLNVTNFAIDNLDYIQANNHYIHKYYTNRLINATEEIEEIIDYNNNCIIRNAGKLHIDTVNLDNDLIVAIGNDKLTVISPSRNMKKKIQLKHLVNAINFTPNPNVIAIHTDVGEYFLNINTEKISKSFDVIYATSGLAYTIEKKLYKINLETLEEELKFSGFKHIGVNKYSIKVGYKDRYEYFRIDLKPLIHEFECTEVV